MIGVILRLSKPQSSINIETDYVYVVTNRPNAGLLHRFPHKEIRDVPVNLLPSIFSCYNFNSLFEF